MKNFTLGSKAIWLFLVILVLYSGCAPLKLESQWRDAGSGRGGMDGIGGRSPGMPGRGFQMPKGLKIWASVTLASAGSSTQGEAWEEMTRLECLK